MENVTIPSLLTSIGDVFEAVINMVASVGETIVASPVLLLACICVPLCGIAVGMWNRIVRSGV